LATKKPVGQRKTRTREHVLADLALNHVERQVFRCGFSAERVWRDYGLDLVLFTYNDRGEVESGQILVQLKATDALPLLRGGQMIAFPLARADLQYWLRETDPVILIVYDGQRDKAYWLYVQAYFEAIRPLDLFTASGQLTVHVPTSNRLTRRAVCQFVRFRDQVQAQTEGRVRHYV